MRRQQSLKGKKGQGLVEFALIIPILLLLLFGIIDFGWIIFNYSQLYNGMREATRYGSVVGFGTVPQLTNCPEIRNQIIRVANFSGVQASAIKIWYDDGRAVADDQVGDNTFSNVVGDCNGVTFSGYASTYRCESPTTCPPRGDSFSVINGDRIVIDLNVTVHFLTPFISTFVPSGIVMHLRNTRSIFPTGLAS